jgi:hypothetical protein
LRFVFFLLAGAFAAAAQPQESPACTTAEACRREARDAIATGEFERAHDLAWLAYQKGSKQDPETLTLVARTQSLSGRADDAFVMLRRLADSGIVVADVGDSEDFRRVRAHASWSELVAIMESIRARATTTAAPAVTPAAVPRAAASPAPAAAKGSRPAPPAAGAEVPTAAVTRAVADLNLPAGVAQPTALAYDAVSARFVLAGAASDSLTVLSQTSTNAASFTAPGWSGAARTTAIAIDRAAGDLWVAVTSDGGGALHRLQLISGRRLEVVSPPKDADLDAAAIVVAPDGVYVLDRAAGRLYRRPAKATALAVHASLDKEITPLGLARSRDGFYVSHEDGVLRIDGASRRQRAVSVPKGTRLGGLHALAWHDRMLFGIQRLDGQLTVVRMRLNAAGTAVTRVERVGPAAVPVATLAAGVYYYVTSADAGGIAVRAINADP